MPKRPLYIAAYDVASPSRRRKVHQAVAAYATGGQKSAFECYLAPRERKALLKQVRRLMDEREDRFALLRVEERAEPVLLGTATLPADPAFLYVG